MFENYENVYKLIKDQYLKNPVYCIGGGGCYVGEEFREVISKWYDWYSGHVEDFHDYKYYNGSNEVSAERKALKMAKKVCEDRADLLINEKLAITMGDKSSQEIIDGIINEDFREQANELMEKMNAGGTGAIVEILDIDKIMFDFIEAPNIIPIEIYNGRIRSVAFVSTEEINGKEILYLSTHIYINPIKDGATEKEKKKRLAIDIPLDYEGYVIENRYLTTKEGGYIDLEVNAEVDPVIITGTEIPFFQIVTPAIANNLTTDQVGYGMSRFSNAIDELKSVDTVYDSYVNEFDVGKTRIFVHDTLARVDISGDGANKTIKPIFDKKQSVFYAIDMGEDAEKIKLIQSKLRIEDHEKGLNKMLNLTGFKCGYGSNYYKFENGVIKTATEVISENNPLYANIKKDRHIVKRALKGMCKALLYLNNEISGTSLNVNQEISIDFDDSIFEDKGAKMKNALLEYSNDLLDPIGYYMTVYNLTEEEATKKWDSIKKRMPEESNVDYLGED